GSHASPPLGGARSRPALTSPGESRVVALGTGRGLPAERATKSWSREIPRPSRGHARGTALAPGTCVVLGWPGNYTPVPPWWPARGRQNKGVGKRVRITCWVDGRPGRRQSRITLKGAGGAAPLAGRGPRARTGPVGLAKALRSRRMAMARKPPDATHARPRTISGLAAPTAAIGAAPLRDSAGGPRRHFRKSRHAVREL